MITLTCKYCGKEFQSERRKTLYCSLNCRDMKMKSKKAIGTFDGFNTYLSARGYEMIVLGRSNEMPLHVYICEKLTGVKLRGTKHVVHHIDGNKLNNAPENLIVLQNTREHMELHTRERLTAKGIDWRTQKYCPRCDKVKGKTDFPSAPKMRDGLHGYCKSCMVKHVKKYQMRKSGRLTR